MKTVLYAALSDVDNLLVSPLVFSLCYKFPDEPRLDGQDKNAAGEKVYVRNMYVRKEKNSVK